MGSKEWGIHFLRSGYRFLTDPIFVEGEAMLFTLHLTNCHYTHGHQSLITLSCQGLLSKLSNDKPWIADMSRHCVTLAVSLFRVSVEA